MSLLKTLAQRVTASNTLKQRKTLWENGKSEAAQMPATKNPIVHTIALDACMGLFLANF